MVNKKRRFPDLEIDEIDRIMTEKDSENTRKATKASVKLFREYLQEKGMSENFEDFDSSLLDSTLSKFYLEMRQTNGEHYKKSTVLAIRHGICRHLQDLKKVNIVHDAEFNISNSAFQASIKELKRQGKGGTKHFPPLEENDLSKLYTNYWDNNSAVKLQQKVFMELMLYFGRRGRENLRTLSVYDVAVTTDDSGKLKDQNKIARKNMKYIFGLFIVIS